MDGNVAKILDSCGRRMGALSLYAKYMSEDFIEERSFSTG